MNEEIRSLITRRRRQILLHSYIYYELNDGKPVCKIKRTDFGFAWPIKEE